MILEELLAHTTEVVLDDRSELLSGAPDSLFSDETIVRYLNEGARQFCRKAWPIVDDTTASCCSIALVAEQDVYSLHASVVRVLSCSPADSDIPFLQLNWNMMSSQVTPGLSDYIENRFAYTYPSGRPTYFSMDEATRKLRIRPKPSAEQVAAIVTLNLRVARMPITLLDVGSPEGVPEIPEEFHMALCTYAGGMALSQGNLDEPDVKRGKDLVAQFYSDIRAAKIDQVVAQKGVGRFVFGGWASHSDGTK